MNPGAANEDDAVWTAMLQYLEGTLPDEEVSGLNHRLREDASLREQFGELMLQQMKLQEIAQEVQLAAENARERLDIGQGDNIVPLPGPEAVPEEETAAVGMETSRAERNARLQRSRVGYRWKAGLAMAACLTLLGVAAWMWFLPAKIATVVTADEGTTIQRGRFTHRAGAGSVLRVGDRIITPEDGRALFSFQNESTEITVDVHTTLGIEFNDISKTLVLREGSLVADVAKQDPAHPLRMVTPETTAEVVGTRFKLSSTDSATKLEVFEGAVRVVGGEGANPLHVPAGHFVRVSPDQVSTLLPLPKSTGQVELSFRGEESSGPAKTKTISLDELMFSGVGAVPGRSLARGYLHPPLSGAYRFQLTSNGRVDLKISDSERPADAVSVVSVRPGSAGTVISDTVPLRAGQRYYFELECESASQPINFTVSWKMPGGMHRVVYGEHLSPFESPLP